MFIEHVPCAESSTHVSRPSGAGLGSLVPGGAFIGNEPRVSHVTWLLGSEPRDHGAPRRWGAWGLSARRWSVCFWDRNTAPFGGPRQHPALWLPGFANRV